MITKLSPELKHYIELNIDDIERGNLITSIIYCPLDIMKDYIDVLKIIDLHIPSHLIPFTDVCCCLAGCAKGGQLNCMKIGSIGITETYEFYFPYQLMDYSRIHNKLINCCSHYFITCDINTDATVVCIKVSVQRSR